MFYKNTANQKLSVFAYDSTTGDPVTGDAANITAQLSLDGGTSAATNDTNPTELDATDHPGIYIFDMTQAETNANMINLSAVSATANVLLEPVIVYTEPATRDANLIQILGTALTETVGGYLAAAFKKFFDVATPVFTSASVNQTGDSYARIDTNGSGLTSLAQSSVWTSTLAASLSPIRSNTAQAGSSTTITLDASASSVTDFYVPCGIYLTGGTGAGQFKTIDEYNGTTKVATISEPWYVTPDNTTTFAIRPEGVAHVDLRQLGGNELSAGYLKAIADVYGINTKIPAQVEGMNTDVISADAVSAAAGAKIADITRRRTQANVESSSDGDTLSLGSLYGLIQQAQESNTVDSPGSLTVYQTDGTTSLGTKALDTDAGADPIVGLS